MSASTVNTPDPFQILPWEDVIFKYIFNSLHIHTLCHLRAVSTTCLHCVQEYLKVKRTINLTWIPLRFNETAFRWLIDGNKSIRRLILRNSKGWMTDLLLQPVLESNKMIKHADFKNCTAISNNSILKLAENNPSLEIIGLQECVWLSVQALKGLSANSPNLHTVNLTGCWEINDDAVISLIHSCQK